MRINVLFSGLFHDIMGTLKLEVELGEGSTVSDLVNSLVRMNNEVRKLLLNDEGKLRNECLIIVNGRDIGWLNGLGTVLHNNDTVLIAFRVFLA